jgi:peptidoglycan/xylan/chitin deacetylase (PgdA/CDA1 family)
VNEIHPDSWDLCVSPKNFVEHLEVLKSHAHPVSLTELLESIDMRKIIDRSVVITFDDGYGDNFLQANPLLELHRIPATFFLTSNCIESSSEFWWDELDQILFQPRRLPQKLRLEISGTVREWDLGPAFDWNPDDEERHREWKYYKPLPTLRHEVFCEVKNLLKQLPDSHRRTAIETIREWAGHKTEVRSTHRTLSIGEIIKLSHRDLNEIGSHSVTHTNLSSLSLTAQREEILRSKSELEVLLKRPITHFAYPYGGKDTYSDDTVRLVQESGYRSACTTSEGVVYQDSDLFHLPRMMVLDWDRKTFARQLARWFKKIPE